MICPQWRRQPSGRANRTTQTAGGRDSRERPDHPPTSGIRTRDVLLSLPKCQLGSSHPGRCRVDALLWSLHRGDATHPRPEREGPGCGGKSYPSSWCRNRRRFSLSGSCQTHDRPKEASTRPERKPGVCQLEKLEKLEFVFAVTMSGRASLHRKAHGSRAGGPGWPSAAGRIPRGSSISQERLVFGHRSSGPESRPCLVSSLRPALLSSLRFGWPTHCFSIRCHASEAVSLWGGPHKPLVSALPQPW